MPVRKGLIDAAPIPTEEADDLLRRAAKAILYDTITKLGRGMELHQRWCRVRGGDFAQSCDPECSEAMQTAAAICARLGLNLTKLRKEARAAKLYDV